MIIANFGQHLLLLAIIWGGFALLTMLKRNYSLTTPFLSRLLRIVKNVVLIVALLASIAVFMLLTDIKEALSFACEVVGKDIELFLRNVIEVLFNTRSFFVVIKMLIAGFVAFSTTICGTAVLVTNLVCLCTLLLRSTGKSTKTAVRQQQTVSTVTNNIFNYQRKYFIRA